MINLRLIFHNGSSHDIIGILMSDESRMQVYEGWSSSYELKCPRFRDLMISITECEGLALVILAKIK